MEEGKETKKKNQKPKTKKPYNRSKRFSLDMAPACVCILSHIRLCATPWTVVCHASLSMRFSRQDYWSGLPFSHPGDLPDPGIEPASPASPVLAGGFSFTTEPPGKPHGYGIHHG